MLFQFQIGEGMSKLGLLSEFTLLLYENNAVKVPMK